MIGRDGDLLGQVAGAASSARGDEVLPGNFAIYDRLPLADAQLVTGTCNDSLDEKQGV